MEVLSLILTYDFNNTTSYVKKKKRKGNITFSGSAFSSQVKK